MGASSTAQGCGAGSLVRANLAWWAAGATVAALALLALLVGAAPATASLPPPVDDETAEQVRVLDQAFPAGEQPLYAWPEGARVLSVSDDRDELRAIDVRSGELLESAALERRMVGPPYDPIGAGRAALDRESGRFVYGYTSGSLVDDAEAWSKDGVEPWVGERLGWLRGAAPDPEVHWPWFDENHPCRPTLNTCLRDPGILLPWLQEVVEQTPDEGAPGAPEVDPGSGGDPGDPPSAAPPAMAPTGSALEPCYRFNNDACFAGVGIVDAETLEPLGTIPLEPFSVDGSPVTGLLRHLELSPPRGPDDAAKVLLVVDELVHEPWTHPALLNLQDVQPRWQGRSNVVWAIQMDLETQAQDWAYRVDDCRGIREDYSGGSAPLHKSWAKRPHAATIFRSLSLEDPAVWIGCHNGRSQQATVVRVPLDEDGFPPANTPVEGQDPGEHTDGALAEGPGYRPESGRGEGPGVQSWLGPIHAPEILADPASETILIRTIVAGDEVWWVFDGGERAFVGTIGMGGSRVEHRAATLDPASGRLYSLSQDHGLFMVDVRRRPVPQALRLGRFAAGGDDGGLMPEKDGSVDVASVVSLGEGGPRWLFTRRGDGGFGGADPSDPWRVVEDRLPVSSQVEDVFDFSGRTLNLEEQEGVTDRSFDATARGYGFRALLVGGVEGAARFEQADPVGVMRGFQYENSDHFNWGTFVPPPDACAASDRELVFGFTGPEQSAAVSEDGARGGTQALRVDGTTRADFEQPVSRCRPGGQEWSSLWTRALVSRAPMSEPSVPWLFDDSQVSCVSQDEDPQESWQDQTVGVFSSQVACDENEVEGESQASGMDLSSPPEDLGDVDLDDVSVSEAISRFHIYLDDERGIVARVESIARGVEIGGVVTIDTIRGEAESWANGRANPNAGSDEDDGEGDQPFDGEGGEDEQAGDAFNPHNCDRSRTAGTCFNRHIAGVHIADGQGGTAYECGPCGDEQALADGLDQAFRPRGRVRLRQPERALAHGAENGYIAAIVKPKTERFADVILHGDLLTTTVPSLEVVRYTEGNRSGLQSSALTDSGGPPGRQVLQFAGVEVSSTYSIQCLLFYDPDANTCDEPPVEPASLTLQLEDAEGAPLAGGEFSLFRDTDGDRLLDDAVDELVHNGECVTVADGECAFDQLLPGAYLVEQTAAPDGFAPVSEPFAVTLAPGVAQTVTFTNVADVATVDIELRDPDGAPIEGAEFALYPDVNGTGELPEGMVTAGEHVRALSDGRQNVSAETPGGDEQAMSAAASGDASPALEPVVTCVTDAEGHCAMTVPPGAYVLVQTHAPEGLEPIEPIAFELAAAGQTAEVSITNVDALGGSEQQAAPEPAPDLRVEDPPPATLPLIDDSPSVAQPAPSPETAQPALPEGFGGTIVRVLRAPGALARLAVRSPMEAAAFAGVWLIWLSAAWLIWRRQRFVREVIGAPWLPGPPPPKNDGGPPGGGTGSAGTPSGGQTGEAGRLPEGDLAELGAGGPPGGADDPPHHVGASAPPAETRPADPGPAPTAALADTGTAVAVPPAAPTDTPAESAPTGGVLERPTPAGGAATGWHRAAEITVLYAGAEELGRSVARQLAESEKLRLATVTQTLAGLRAQRAEHEPDIVVVDLDLGISGGPPLQALAGEVLSAQDPQRTVGLVNSAQAAQALLAGSLPIEPASLLMTEDLDNGTLALAIRYLLEGKTFHGAGVQTLLRAPRQPEARRSASALLTDRELQLAQLAAEGTGLETIADELGIRVPTVASHLSAARDKLGLKNVRGARALRDRLQELGLDAIRPGADPDDEVRHPERPDAPGE